MDVFLIKDNVIVTIVGAVSVEDAKELFKLDAVERTTENQHLNIGDAIE